MGKNMYGSIPAFWLNGENQSHQYQRHIEELNGRKAVQDIEIFR